MRRISTLVLVICGLVTLPLPALAVDLDQTVCEGDLFGTWDGAANTCTANFSDPFGVDLTIPSGFVFNVDFLDSFDFEVDNFGTINANFWHNHGQVENYGTFIVEDLIHDDVVNHCGSSFTVTTDDSNSLSFLVCTVNLSLTPDPSSGTDPVDVEWAVSITNDGDEALSGLSIELSYDEGATAFDNLTPPPDSGDDGDDLLEPGETWLFSFQTTESADVTITATSSGIAPSGLAVTFPDDGEARAQGAVTVTAAATTTTEGATTSTEEATTTSDAEVGAGSDSLPFTGAGDMAWGSMLAISLIASGIVLLSMARARPADE